MKTLQEIINSIKTKIEKDKKESYCIIAWSYNGNYDNQPVSLYHLLMEDETFSIKNYLDLSKKERYSVKRFESTEKIDEYIRMKKEEFQEDGIYFLWKMKGNDFDIFTAFLNIEIPIDKILST